MDSQGPYLFSLPLGHFISKQYKIHLNSINVSEIPQLDHRCKRFVFLSFLLLLISLHKDKDKWQQMNPHLSTFLWMISTTASVSTEYSANYLVLHMKLPITCVHCEFFPPVQALRLV